jgi:hypothetical protein
MSAATKVLPKSLYQFCQAHSLRHLAELLAEADAACTVVLRKAVRQQVGDVIRQEPRATPAPIGRVTVTGLFPSPLGPPPASWTREAQSPPPSASPAADAIVTSLVRHTRYLLTLTGRPPLRLAGLETYERLDHVARLRLALVAERYAPRLAQLSPGLQVALSPCAATSQALQPGAAWLRDIAFI